MCCFAAMERLEASIELEEERSTVFCSEVVAA
jgi:hypothetical protein